MKLVKNMSLHEVKQTEGESRIHQWRSMTLNQEKTGSSNGNRGTTSLPGNQAWSKRDQADENEVTGVSSRRTKLTDKGSAYTTTVLKERREKINRRMMKKCSIVEDLLFSNKNRVVVGEELTQFNELFRMLLSIYEEYNQLLDDDKRADEDDWFDDLDNRVCTFKRKIHSWLRSAETERKSSKGSLGSSESRQRKSSRGTRKVQSSHARELKEKARMTGLIAEAVYTEQRQPAENQAEMLIIQQEIAKNKASVEVCGKHNAKSIDGRNRLSNDKKDLTQRCQQMALCSNGLVVKVLDSQSRGLVFKTTG